MSIKVQNIDSIEFDCRKGLLEFPFRIMPKNNSGVFLIEDALEACCEPCCVHIPNPSSSTGGRKFLTSYGAIESPPFPKGDLGGF